MISVLALTRYGLKGSASRQRFHLYRPALAAAGFEVEISPFLPDCYLERLYAGERVSWATIASAYRGRISALLRAGRFDVLWVEKEALPWLPSFVDQALLGDTPLALDFDDAWHYRYQQHKFAPIRRLIPRKLEKLAARAALVIVGNAYLEDWAREAGARNVLTLPTVVDLERYSAAPETDEPFTLGWIGTPMTAAYLHEIAPPLAELSRTHGARLRAIGAGADFRLPGVTVLNEPWDEATEGTLVGQCHVGLMPLPDEPFERGKCGYKLIQYMAAGRPVVASPVGANRGIVSADVGFLAETSAQWLSAMTRLADEPALRRKMGENARQRAADRYALANAAPILVDALRSLADAAKRGR